MDSAERNVVALQTGTRFLNSYGSWTELAAMLTEIEFLRLQQVCKLAYNVSISRV